VENHTCNQITIFFDNKEVTRYEVVLMITIIPGTRPEIIKMAPVVRACRESPLMKSQG
jgi:hypothetical protein